MEKKYSDSEIEEAKYIIKNYDESNPKYKNASEIIEYEIKRLKENHNDIEKQLIDQAKQILKALSYNDRQEIRKKIHIAKKKRLFNKGQDWHERFEELNPELGYCMAIAYEQLYGKVE